MLNNDYTHSESGFTLVEVVVAIAIFSLACVASMELMSWSVRANAFSNRITGAMNRGHDKMEDLLLLGPSGIVSSNDTVDIYQRSWTANYQGLASAVSVVVSWNDLDGDTHSVRLNNIVE